MYRRKVFLLLHRKANRGEIIVVDRIAEFGCNSLVDEILSG